MSSIHTRVAVFDANETASPWLTQWAAESATEIVLNSRSVDEWVAHLPQRRFDIVLIDCSAARLTHPGEAALVGQLKCPLDSPVVVLVSSEEAATDMRNHLGDAASDVPSAHMRVVVAPVSFRELSAHLDLSLAVSARAAEHDFATHIVDRIAQGICVTDKDSRFEFVNKAYADLFGWTPEELLGRTPAYVTVDRCQEGLAEQGVLRRAGKTTTY